MSKPNSVKVTVGFVTQVFNDKGKCIAQTFTAGDTVDWENEKGQPIEEQDWYHPFEMKNPN